MNKNKIERLRRKKDKKLGRKTKLSSVDSIQLLIRRGNLKAYVYTSDVKFCHDTRFQLNVRCARAIFSDIGFRLNFELCSSTFKLQHARISNSDPTLHVWRVYTLLCTGFNTKIWKWHKDFSRTSSQNLCLLVLVLLHFARGFQIWPWFLEILKFFIFLWKKWSCRLHALFTARRVQL